MTSEARCLAHLKELTQTPGLPGYETATRDLIRAAWAPLTDEIHQDGLGSLWAVKFGKRAPGGGRFKVMLAAHMDAIGLMVTQVDGEFLRVTKIGGIDARVMPGQIVMVHAKQDLPGVVARPPAFLLPSAHREGVAPLSELLVDTGLPAERLRGLVKVGDVISFTQPPVELLNGFLSAKSLDNRASVAALTLCLEALQDRPHVWDVVAVATVQEETTFAGAIASAFALEPDLAVAVDVTHGRDANNKELPHETFPLGNGPTLGLGPNIHPGLHAAFKDAAGRAEIPYSVEPMPMHSGTDAFAIQVAREGIPTMVVSIPLRNMHTPVEIVAVKDVVRAGRLLAEFVSGLTAGFMNTLTLDM